MTAVASCLTVCVWTSDREDCVVPVILLACLMMRDSEVFQDEMLYVRTDSIRDL